MINSDIVRGHLDTIILRLISEQDRYGYEISREISGRTAERFQVKEATLYAAFQRLEKRGLIRSYEGGVSLGSRRRYYAVTAKGRAALASGIAEWQEIKEIIDILLEGGQ
jgi:PadR family transcriptional regulator PadR